MTQLILASASPRRKDLLGSIGIVPDAIIAPDIDEASLPKERPAAYAQRMASEKMMAIQDKYPDAIIITADTVVTKGLRILPKAETEADFDHCMSLLSGGNHTTMTAICVRNPNTETRQKLVQTKLKVKRLHPSEISKFKSTQEWQGKAGGYALQGFFGQFIQKISGSYSGVVGLPIYETANLLQWAGYSRKNMP